MIKVTDEKVIFFNENNEEITEKYNYVHDCLNDIGKAINDKDIADYQKFAANVALVELIKFIENEWHSKIINTVEEVLKEHEKLTQK